MTITRIEHQKKNHRCANIFLDGEFAFGLHTEILIRFGLRTGDTIAHDRVKEIERAEEEYLARHTALRYIRYRLRSEKELRARLSTAEFPPDVIDRVINQLIDNGLIDDRRFARAFVHDLQLRKPSGIRILKQRLRLKGVPKIVVDETMTELASSDLQLDGAMEAAKKYLQRIGTRRRAITALEREQKVGKYLEQRGFEWETISTVLLELFRHHSTIE
jgi:regulatory protein